MPFEDTGSHRQTGTPHPTPSITCCLTSFWMILCWPFWQTINRQPPRSVRLSVSESELFTGTECTVPCTVTYGLCSVLVLASLVPPRKWSWKADEAEQKGYYTSRENEPRLWHKLQSPPHNERNIVIWKFIHLPKTSLYSACWRQPTSPCYLDFSLRKQLQSFTV